MFGKNDVAPKRDTEQSFLVKSIFYTIQGEGPNSGMPAVFVRLGGCNLKCKFCDTDFTTDLDEMTAEQVCKAIETENDECNLIVITGGEPMLQNLQILIETISGNLPHINVVQIETAGTVWPMGFENVVMKDEPTVEIVCSPKTPKVHPLVHRHAQAWKYVVNSKMLIDRDGLPVCHAKPPDEEDDCEHGYQIFMAPMDEIDEVVNQANVEFARDLCLSHGHRLSLQIHKLIGVD